MTMRNIKLNSEPLDLGASSLYADVMKKLDSNKLVADQLKKMKQAITNYWTACMSKRDSISNSEAISAKATETIIYELSLFIQNEYLTEQSAYKKMLDLLNALKQVQSPATANEQKKQQLRLIFGCLDKATQTETNKIFLGYIDRYLTTLNKKFNDMQKKIEGGVLISRTQSTSHLPSSKTNVNPAMGHSAPMQLQTPQRPRASSSASSSREQIFLNPAKQIQKSASSEKIKLKLEEDWTAIDAKTDAATIVSNAAKAAVGFISNWAPTWFQQNSSPKLTDKVESKPTYSGRMANK